MTPADDVAARRCKRTFTILTSTWPEWPSLSAGDVRVTWACGATRVFRNRVAIDVEFLADHLPWEHHHHLHLPRRTPRLPHQGAKR